MRIYLRHVASFTDAWIETYKEIIEGRFDVSHLLQMRGLKLLWILRLFFNLKVASFTDAWIETIDYDGDASENESHLLQMRGLKLLVVINLMMLLTSHLLQMRGLKQERDYSKSHPCGRIFYRCVD